MNVRHNSMYKGCACKPATAYCLWKATVATHFCGVQHKKPPVIRQLFAVVTSWHLQFKDQSVSWYAQAVVAQYMVQADCEDLKSICRISRVASIVSGSRQSSNNKEVTTGPRMFLMYEKSSSVSTCKDGSCRAAKLQVQV